MTTALASLLTGRPVKHTVGMTGEVTLQGRVLPIGGLKQKVLARPRRRAHRRDPARAQPRRPRRRPGGRAREMAFHPVMTIDEVLSLASSPRTCRRRCSRTQRAAPSKGAALHCEE